MKIYILFLTLTLSSLQTQAFHKSVQVIQHSEHITTSVLDTKALAKKNKSFQLLHKFSDTKSAISKYDWTNRVCLSESTEMGLDPNCDSQNIKPLYIERLRSVYDQLPEYHQKLFNNLQRIQIHKKIYSIGYANQVVSNENQLVGHLIGLREDLILFPEKTKDVITWKEHLNFGLSDKNDPERKVTSDAFHVLDYIDHPFPQIYYVVLHEINHIVDFVNNITIYTNTSNKGVENCIAETHSTQGYKTYIINKCSYKNNELYESLSWGPIAYRIFDYTEVEEEGWDFYNDYFSNLVFDIIKNNPLLKNLCYYYCNKPSNTDQIEETYTTLNKTNFLTGYSTSSKVEDFAEAATFYNMKQINMSFEYKIILGDGKVLFNIHEQLKSPIVQEKWDWLDKFFRKVEF